MSEGAWFVVFAIIGVAVWFWLGDPSRDVRRLFGQQTYADQTADLSDYLKHHRHGTGSDVWLMKGSFGVEDRVAVYFGYMDDFAACYESAQILNERYPNAYYSCRTAN